MAEGGAREREGREHASIKEHTLTHTDTHRHTHRRTYTQRHARTRETRETRDVTTTEGEVERKWRERGEGVRRWCLEIHALLRCIQVAIREGGSVGSQSRRLGRQQWLYFGRRRDSITQMLVQLLRISAILFLHDIPFQDRWIPNERNEADKTVTTLSIP